MRRTPKKADHFKCSFADTSKCIVTPSNFQYINAQAAEHANAASTRWKSIWFWKQKPPPRQQQKKAIPVSHNSHSGRFIPGTGPEMDDEIS